MESLDLNALYGAWVYENKLAVVFLPDGRFQSFDYDSDLPDGLEVGTYSFNESSGAIGFQISYDDSRMYDADSAQWWDGGFSSADLKVTSITSDQLVIDVESEGLLEQGIGFTKVENQQIQPVWYTTPGSDSGDFFTLVLAGAGWFLWGENDNNLPDGLEYGDFLYRAEADSVEFTNQLDYNDEGGIFNRGISEQEFKFSVDGSNATLAVVGVEEDYIQFVALTTEAYQTSADDLASDSKTNFQLASEHLANFNLSVDIAKNFLLDNVDSPEYIFTIAQDYHVNEAMLAGIVGLELLTVRGYFEGYGLDSSLL